MQNSRSTWSRFLTGLAGTSLAVAPLRGKPRRRATRGTALWHERLEDRALLAAASISIADATVLEGPTSLGILDPGGAAAVGTNGIRGIVLDSMPGHPHSGDLFVTGWISHSVARFDWASQTYKPFVASNSGGLGEAYGIAIGPDGNVYVSDPNQNAVFRYDGSTGVPLPAAGRPGAVFVADDPNTPTVNESGGLTQARGITFGADGNLYVSSRDTNQILRYQGPAGSSPGAFLGVFASISNASSPTDLTFAPDGNLYVSCFNMGVPNSLYGQINRYDGLTGVPLGTGVFVPLASGGLIQPRQIVFDAQGTNMYVVEAQTGPGQEQMGQVLRYQGPNGPNPGAYVEPYVTSGQGGLSIPIGLARDAAGNLYVSDRDTANVTRFAPTSQARFVVTLDTASTSSVSVDYATANGSGTAGSDYVQTSGTLVFAAGETSKAVVVPTLDDLVGEPAETFRLDLSNAVNTTIARSQAVGTILDNETKFYVVDGTSGSPRTYEYGSGGISEEIYPARDTNTAPRGVASNAAGTTVWVVDANKNVFVYNNGGALLGSWTAGGLNSLAQVEGITTNGTDIWLVDNKTDKVFKYAGAASRLSGSQTATSSFSLNSGNTSPKDLVTDGASIWVVNDTSTDKVFKYTVSGSPLGSWTISTSGATSPTGVTLDPASPSHLWIVDSGTDLVYQYDAAVSRTSGSQAASTSFRLAAGNTNPQGIADPPQQGSLTSSAIKVSAGTSSVATPVMPPTYASPAASSSVSIVPNTTSELATQYQAHRANWSLRNELTNTTNKPLASGSKKSIARRGELRSETSVRNVPNFAPADQLDGIFEDWSSDPLQLLLRITKS